MRLGRNIAFNLAGHLAMLLLSFVVIRSISHRLGNEQLGLIYFGLALGGLFAGSLQLGLTTSLARQIAIAPQADETQHLVQATALVYWAITVVAVVALYALAPLLARHWLIAQRLAPAAEVLPLRLIGCFGLLALPRMVNLAAMRGAERMDLANVVEVGGYAFQQGGIIAVLSRWESLTYVSLWIALSSVLLLAFSFWGASHCLPLRALLPRWRPAALRQNARASLRVGMTGWLSIAQLHGARLITSKLLPLQLFGMFSVALGTVTKIDLVPDAIAMAAFPVFSAQRQDEVADRYHDLQQAVCFVTAALLGSLTIFAIPILSFALGADAAGPLFLPFAVLAAGAYLNAALSIPYTVSVARGEEGIVARTSAIGLPVALAATIFLVWKWSLLGAALGWSLYYCFAFFHAAPTITRRCLPGVRPWWVEAAKGAMAAGCGYTLGWLVTGFKSAASLPWLAAGWALGTIVTLVLMRVLAPEMVRRSLERVTAMVLLARQPEI